MDVPRPPASLIARLRANPARAPELLALAAADHHGPRAAAWLAKQDTSKPDRLARRIKRQHARMARFDGAVAGLGGWVTILPDLAALAWIQSRLTFLIAGAYGFDPRDPMRPAEFLTLRGLYPDPVQARAALDGVGRSLAVAMVEKSATSERDEKLFLRFARLAGTRGAERLAGRVIPGAASIFNALSDESETRTFADRAIRFYRG